MELLHGIVHGRVIELENELGFPDGQSVTVVVHPEKPTIKPGEPAIVNAGIRHSFGAWADDATELDAYLEWNRRQRKTGREEIDP